MDCFDFHHHHKGQDGIYNVDLFSDSVSSCFSVGLHPKDITNTVEQSLDWVASKARDNGCVAIGECGLDSLVDASPALQAEVFRWHIDLANALEKPLIIHCVRRHAELLSFASFAKVPMVVHGFNKKKSIAESLLAHGFYLSFGTSLLENLSLQSAFLACPLDRLVLETDTSDVDIGEVYRKAASLKALDLEALELVVKRNLKSILI